MLNGPNLASLGTRQPEIYGNGSLADLIDELVAFGRSLGVEVAHAQTHDEAELIRLMATADADGIILNPGALGHTSRALGDAVRSSSLPTVEVHITNVKAREPWRAVSMLEDACVGTIFGRGRSGYRDAIRHLVNRWAAHFDTARYGPHPINVGELRPGKGLVVLVHGGIWRRQYGRDSMESLAVDLAERGVGTWNIGYRRLGEGGGWPGSGHDVLTALDHTTSMGSSRVVVVGHSAGGYLALWAADRTSAPLGLVVALAPIANLELAAADDGELSGEATALLGSGAPSRPVPAVVPTLVVHGTHDAVVPVEHSHQLDREPGVEVAVVRSGHFDLLAPSKPHWQSVVDRISSVLRAGD